MLFHEEVILKAHGIINAGDVKKKKNKTWTAKNGIQPATYEEWIVQQLQQ